jgi:hypothetical protein
MGWLQCKSLRGKGLWGIFSSVGRGRRVSNIQQVCIFYVFAFQKNNISKPRRNLGCQWLCLDAPRFLPRDETPKAKPMGAEIRGFLRFFEAESTPRAALAGNLSRLDSWVYAEKTQV